MAHVQQTAAIFLVISYVVIVSFLQFQSSPTDVLHSLLRSPAMGVTLESHELDALNTLRERRMSDVPPEDVGWSHRNPVPAVIPESLRLKRVLENHGIPMDSGRVDVDVVRGILGPLRQRLGRGLEEVDPEGIPTSTLSWANTEPLKIEVNWSNMSPDTAKPFTTCFAIGDWSFSGAMNPGNPPPHNSPEYPVCDYSNYDVFATENVACWYQCGASDILNSQRLNWLKQNVNEAVRVLETIYRIPKMSSPLAFTKTRMADFSNNVLGWTNLEVCGAATFAYCDTLMPETYCTDGVPNGGNVVLNMVYKPYMWGGALGGSCEFDDRNR